MPDEPTPAPNPGESFNPVWEAEFHGTREMIEEAIAPLIKRIEALEKELAALKKASSRSQHR